MAEHNTAFETRISNITNALYSICTDGAVRYNTLEWRFKIYFHIVSTIKKVIRKYSDEDIHVKKLQRDNAM